jgi:hypothetical protein
VRGVSLAFQLHRRDGCPESGICRTGRFNSSRRRSARWKAGTWRTFEFANDFDLLLSIRSLYLIRRIFAPFAGLLFGLWGCYPAKLLFGLLQLSSEALDESIIFCSHIDLRGLIIFKMSWNECWIQGSCGV